MRTLAALALFCLPFQSPIGSWHVIDMKETFTDTKSGKTVDANTAEPGMLDDLKKQMEYNCQLLPDHSVVMQTGFKGSKLLEIKGTYTLDGDKLRFKGTTPDAFKGKKSGSPTVIPDFVTLTFEGGRMTWHYAVETEEEGHSIRSDIYLIWQRK